MDDFQAKVKADLFILQQVEQLSGGLIDICRKWAEIELVAAGQSEEQIEDALERLESLLIDPYINKLGSG